MYSLILSLVLSSPNVLAERAQLEVDGKDCKVKAIKYDETHNIIWAMGNCQVIYDMCTEDFCRVKKMQPKELNFSVEEYIGNM